MGDHAEASRLFELALKSHMTIARKHEQTNHPPPQQQQGDNEQMEDDSTNRVTTTAAAATNTTSQELLNVSNAKIQRLNASIRRMTTSSRLPITPFCGQQRAAYKRRKGYTTNSNSDNNNNNTSYKFHQVYCLPIVMDDHDWQTATLDDKTFVLIFNTAVCNHLWGIGFQEQVRYREETQADLQAKRAFLVANQLYRLAMNSMNRLTHSYHNGYLNNNENEKCGSSCIDHRFFLVALLNNMSHVTKTLGNSGAINSQKANAEALHFDRMLLKAIFWYKDSQPVPPPAQPEHSTVTTTTATSAMPNSIAEESNNNDNDWENAESDANIVETFFDHVFYLIGTPEAIVPAPAA